MKFFVQEAKKGEVNAQIYYPRKGLLLINFHCYDAQRNFMTLGLLMPVFSPGVAVQLASGEVVRIPIVGDKEYARVTGFLIAQKDLVNKEFEASLGGLCKEGKVREACDCCKNFDQKIFDYVKTNMNTHWFKTKEKNEKK